MIRTLSKITRRLPTISEDDPNPFKDDSKASEINLSPPRIFERDRKVREYFSSVTHDYFLLFIFFWDIMEIKLGNSLGASLHRGELPYQSDGGDHRRKVLTKSLKRTRILFCGRGSNPFLSLRRANSKTKLILVIFLPALVP